jgi:hypothetical protein
MCARATMRIASPQTAPLAGQFIAASRSIRIAVEEGGSRGPSLSAGAWRGPSPQSPQSAMYNETPP